eukprot:421871_1
MTSLQPSDVFKDIESACLQENILNCKSVERIKIILNTFNDKNMENKDANELTQLINTIFNDHYTNTQLINDFNHIKYHHHADDKDEIFAETFKHFTNSMQTDCHFQKCKSIERRYKDRSKLINKYTISTDTKHNNYYDFHNEYIIKLITRIHVYFLHSYDLLYKPEHLNTDDENKKNQPDDEIAKAMNIIAEKRSTLQVSLNNTKYIEMNEEHKHDFIDYQEICQSMKRQKILIQEAQLRTAFSKYKDDKNKFISDIIDAYCANDDLNEIKLGTTEQSKKKIYQHILKTYVKPSDLNNHNLIKITQIIIKESYADIDAQQVVQIAARANINGKLFIKGNPEFKNSTKFGKMFKDINGYNKKHFAQIYTKIHTNSWLNISALKINVIEHKENLQIVAIKNDNNLYELGTRFYFWNCKNDHQNYIKRKYLNLKEEMLKNNVIAFDITRWDYLNVEAETDLKTDEAKHIVSNGFDNTIYGIDLSTPLTIQHLCALKLYTDYTKECELFCATLRSENKIKITQIANWAKLLIECVQCYGNRLKGNKRYYRGVNKVFRFHSFVARFNLPTSTTTSLEQAISFSDNIGLTFELRKYKQRYDVFKFDCSKLSGFGSEKETLFFGGDTVLKISSIWQIVNNKWE